MRCPHNFTHGRRPRTSTKSESENTLSQLEDLLDEAPDPDLSREEVIAKVKEVYDLVTDEGTGAEDEDEPGE